MKDRRTHLAHKAEHTVDLETQAIVAVSLADANEGDTSSLPWSLLRAETNLSAVATDPRRLLIHVGAFNLSLLMRQLLGAGTPRGFAALVRTLESIVASTGSTLSNAFRCARRRRTADRPDGMS